MNDDQLLRYSRHILLPQIGIEGQEKLLAAHALVIGAGGLGSPVALYLASAGVGRLTICDGDDVDLTNLQRQIVHRMQAMGMKKAESARATLAGINPEVAVAALAERVDEKRLETLAAAADIVLDGSDNFVTRHAVNRVCVRLGKPLVSGAAVRFDGQVAVFDMRADGLALLLVPVSGARGVRGRALRGDGRVRAVDRDRRLDTGGGSAQGAHGRGRNARRQAAPPRCAHHAGAHHPAREGPGVPGLRQKQSLMFNAQA